jgi:hypothetical protein
MAQPESQYIRWQVPEYRVPQRDKKWYLIAGILTFVIIFFCFFTISHWRLVYLGSSANFLFAFFIIVAAIITIVNESRPPLLVNVEMGPEGLKIGSRFYDYDSIKNFTVLYKPKQSLKSVYFEFKNTVHPRLALPLRRLDALTVRNFLIRYLDENLERTEMPLSERLTKLLKL